ncbi:Vesicular glutamate transporter 2 [Acropora cervicornis]|uniref:Vesicular glutamate transporter 2 n=1 Tax=Acropora cervicornis TaxID=6130 RepID=A0AAD9R516_ACRCE|nr:Vesicular glutamate transporter 2 [Acropora cervicornis]
MAKSAGDLESGLTRFLNTLYACFRFMSRFLILCQFCECPTNKRKTRKRESEDQFEDGMSTGFDTETGVTRRAFTFPKRYILVIMTFLGFMNMYALRVNLNVAIGAMVNNHTIQAKGYTITRLPSGCLALRLGGTRIFGYAIFLASMLTLLTPVATRYSVYGMIAVRAGEGLMLGAVFPCNHAIWSKWAPPLERTTLVTLAISGCHVGTIITMPLSGLLTKYGFDGGWASVFYCFGAAGILWFAAWQLVVHESPTVHPTISDEEKRYIEESFDQGNEDVPIPWKSILTSVPVWGIMFGNLASDWGLYTILICLPMFLLDILHFDIQTSLSGPFGGITADLLRRKGLSTRSVRRLYFAVGYAKSATIAVTCMCIGVASSGLMHSGYNVNMLDIAPRYACVIMGITNTVGTITGFLSPMMVGFITVNKKVEEWRTVFWVTFVIYFVGTLLFCTLMSADLQPWATGEAKPKQEENEDVGMEEQS